MSLLRFRVLAKALSLIALVLILTGCNRLFVTIPNPVGAPNRLFLTIPNPAAAPVPCNPCLEDRSSAATISAGTVATDAVTVDPTRRLQALTGVGFTLTDSSAYLIDQVPNDQGQRDALMKRLFDPDTGLGISWLRVIIGPSDFTVTPRPWYSYEPTAQDGFAIDRARPGAPNGDLSHIIPLLRQALTLSKGHLFIFANPHSAPAWMKANNDMWNLNGDGCLLGNCVSSPTDMRDLYAQYFIDFIKAYQAQGVPIQAIGVQNEPNNVTDYPGGNFASADQLNFIARLRTLMAAQNPPLQQQLWGEFGSWEAASILTATGQAGVVDGMAFHCYFSAPGNLDDFHSVYPNKSINETECTQDYNAVWPKTIDILLGDLGHWANVVANWNVALDPTGGPQASCSSTTYAKPVNPAPARTRATNSTCTIHGTTMTAPVVIDQGVPSFTREYYEMAQVSEFVRPGAVHLATTSPTSVLSVAFQDPDGSRVVVAHNQRTTPMTLTVNIDGGHHFAPVDLAPDEIATFSWQPSTK